MRILLTGAAGFVGSHVAEALLGRGDEIVGLDNFDDGYDVARKKSNAALLDRWPGWMLVRGDARDRALVQRVCSVDGIEAVVHLAARCGLEEARREPERHCEVNVTGTASVLEAAHRGGVKRFLLASSACVYGAEAAPQSTATPADRPLSVHAATRRSAELLCAAFAEREGLNTTVLRLFSVYGPRQRPDGAVQARSFATWCTSRTWPRLLRRPWSTLLTGRRATACSTSEPAAGPAWRICSPRWRVSAAERRRSTKCVRHPASPMP